MRGSLLLLALVSCSACISTSFTRTGFDTPPKQASPPCKEAVVLQRPPADRRFIELGFCTTSVPGGGVVTDNTPDAIKQLQKCACENGGNAVVFMGDSDTGVHTMWGASQQRVRGRGSVLYVYPKDEAATSEPVGLVSPRKLTPAPPPPPPLTVGCTLYGGDGGVIGTVEEIGNDSVLVLLKNGGKIHISLEIAKDKTRPPAN